MVSNRRIRLLSVLLGTRWTSDWSARRERSGSTDATTCGSPAPGSAPIAFMNAMARSISNAIVTEKAEAVERTGADLLLSGDLGCLMNMAGKLHRRGAKTRCFHTIEVVAGRAGGPAIGEEG